MPMYLQIVHNSYGEALNSLAPPYLSRSEMIERLSTISATLTTRISALTAVHSPLSRLSTNSSRLLYSQSILDDKLADVLEFKRMLLSKIGAQDGRLIKDMNLLVERQSGMRRLVRSMQVWGDWARFLATRFQWHFLSGLRSPDNPPSAAISNVALAA